MAGRRAIPSNEIHWLALAMTALVACGGDDTTVLAAPRDDGGTNKSTTHHPPADAGPDGGTKPVMLHPQPDGGMSNHEEDGGSDPASCGEVNCGLHGDCVMGMDGKPGCVCDHGYIVNDGRPTAAGICIEDKSCVTARVLQCRYNDGGSAVGLHFSLQYCSGNPYTSLDVKDLVIEEKGNEDFQELLPSESFASIVRRDFLTHVYLVVDISNSIQQSDVLGDVASGIKTLFTELKKDGGNFRVSVFLFDGRPSLYEFIADTSDLADASSKLDALKEQQGNDLSSSNVYGAVLEGIRKVDRARQLRTLVNNFGVLTSGTLIVVSDGDDRASLRTFADVQAGVAATNESVITVGLGDVANYPKLTLIGRDGSFSAPEPSLVNAAFEQIAGRIKDDRRSQYLVGYCSPKRKDSFDTRVGVRGLTFDQPHCTFSAARFVGGCNADVFDPAKACADSECGGIVGCGECAAGSCCSAGKCVAPGTLPADGTCGQEWQCSTGTTCSADKCTAAVAQGIACDGTHLCDSGAAYCASPDPMADPVPPAVCLEAKGDGFECKENFECVSRYCGLPPDQPFATSKICLDDPEMYTSCSAGVCEHGSYCDGTTCQPMKTALCDANPQCESGSCETLVSGTKMCGGAPQCFFPLEL